MDILEVARERRRALISELERLDALLNDAGSECGAGKQQTENAQVIPFPQKRPRVLRQYPSKRS